MKTYVHLWYLAEFVFRMRYVSGKSGGDNQDKHCATPSPSLSPRPRNLCRLWDNVEKYDRTRQATDDSTVQTAHKMCDLHTA